MSQAALPRRTSPWAIILIAIGVIWLLAQANVFSAANLSVLFRFWPLILIAFGLELLVGRNNQRLSLLIIAGTVIVLIVLMLVGPSVGLAQTAEIKTAAYTTPLGEAQSARVVLNANVSQVIVNPATAADTLFDADIAYIGDISFDDSLNGTEGVITLESRGTYTTGNIFFFTDWLTPFSDVDWNIGINPAIPLELDVNTGTGSVDLNLADMQISDVRVNAGTGSVNAVLPSMADAYDARIETGTGGGTIRVGEGAALRLLLSSGTGGMTVDVPDDAAVRVVGSVGTGGITVPGWLNRVSGDSDSFIGEAGTWETAGFDDAARQIIVEFSGGTGGLTIR